jgi:allophanate hydrolase
MGDQELCLTFDRLQEAYQRGQWSPADVVDEAHRRIEQARANGQKAWLHVRERGELLAEARTMMMRKASGEHLPLFGLPFAVKDSIDVAGMPTTVACPALARVPGESAPVVRRLIAAGAIVVGKTNLDQLAMGLVGVRSPYGVPVNPFDKRMIPGGSSSGSAVALATGQVSFALATDTAGSGRVPAAFNNVVGLKPTRGMLSMRGVAPACRTVDCCSVFGLTVGDACAVLDRARGWDEDDPFSRPEFAALSFAPRSPALPWRIGVPRPSQLEFFGDAQAAASFAASMDRFCALGCAMVEVDFAPFREAGELLYGGPWVAERLVIGGELLDHRPDELLPVIREILQEARRYDALDTFRATYALASLRQKLRSTWNRIDALLVPTTPTIYSVAEVVADPRSLNANLGIYTTFANLLDLMAIAIPAGFRPDGLPAGVTLLGPAGSDARVAAIADAHHRRLGGRLGATKYALSPDPRPAMADTDDRVRLAVVGAHLSGQPLNGQLTDAHAALVRTARTSPRYRLFALPAMAPPKPGLIRTPDDGRAIEVEVWALDAAQFGGFVARVQPPLSIGSIELEDGSWVHGFLCEPHAVQGAEDISEWGGWRAYLKKRGAVA